MFLNYTGLRLKVGAKEKSKGRHHLVAVQLLLLHLPLLGVDETLLLHRLLPGVRHPHRVRLPVVVVVVVELPRPVRHPGRGR